MIPEGYRLASVQAVARNGYDGFCRGGRRWPSSEPTLVVASPALLALLKAEQHLRVDSGVDSVGVDIDSVPVLDVPPPTYVDENARALEEVAQLDREIAAEKAKAVAAAKRLELEQLRKANEEAAKAEAAAKVDVKPPPPPANPGPPKNQQAK